MQLGIDDPEQWLEDSPKRVVDLWSEYAKLEPFGLPWHQSATIANLLDWILCQLAASSGGKMEPRKFADFMPVGFVDHSETVGSATDLAKNFELLVGRVEKAITK